MENWISNYKKIFGIFGLLVGVCAFTAFMAPESFLKAANIENTVRWTALFGIISVGVAFVIMTGGIDLSIGSIIGLVGCILAMCLSTTYMPIDSFDVTKADPTSRTLTIDGAALFKPGEKIRFLDDVFTVDNIDEGRLTVQESFDSTDVGLDAGRVD